MKNNNRERRVYDDGTRSSYLRRRDFDRPFFEVLTKLSGDWRSIDVDQVKVFYTNKDNELVRTELEIAADRVKDLLNELDPQGQRVAVRITLPPDERGYMKQRLYMPIQFNGLGDDFDRHPYLRFTTEQYPITHTVGRAQTAAVVG